MNFFITEGVDLRKNRAHSGNILLYMLHLVDIYNPANIALIFIEWKYH